MPLSQAAANALNDSAFRSVSYTPAGQFIAIFTAMPSITDTGAVEVSGTAYARQAISFSASSARTSASNALVTFPAAGSNWAPIGGPAIGTGIYDAVTSGTLIASSLLSTGSSPLAVGITNSATSATVVSGTPFAGISFVLIDQEQCGVSVVGTTLTISRAQNGTSAASHATGATVYALTPQTINTGNVFTIPSTDFTSYLL